MKGYQVVLIIVIICFVTIFYFRWQKDIVNYPPRGTNIVAFGDSLVEGIGATKGNDFVSLVSKKLDIEIKNFGHAGDTTSDGLGRIENVLQTKPDIVILLLGGNDAIRKIPIDVTRNNLRIIIQKFQENGALVVLLGVRGGLLTDPYDTMYKKTGHETGSVYIENVLKGLFGDARYMSDAIHPNDRGYEVIADRVYPVIIDILNRNL